MGDFGENLFFSHDMLFLRFFDDVFLLEDLESEELIILLAINKTHLGIGALSDHALEGEIVYGGLLHLVMDLAYFL